QTCLHSLSLSTVLHRPTNTINTTRCLAPTMIYFFPSFFFFHDTPTTEIYTLSLHDALPISCSGGRTTALCASRKCRRVPRARIGDRKSTRLNSSHVAISYAVFCLKKKKPRGASGALHLERSALAAGVRSPPAHRPVAGRRRS